MLSEYRTLFDARGARYNAANRLYPEAGGHGAEASVELVHWRFASAGHAARFRRELFGLDPDTREESLEALDGLGGFARDGAWLLPWEMVFASAAA